MSTDEHLAQLNKVAVVLVVDLNDTPWVSATTNLAAFWGRDLGIGSNNGERYL